MYYFKWVLHIITAQMMKEVILMKSALNYGSKYIP